jgi:hypothetical protein
MNVDAALSTGFVHFLGAVLALTPLGHRHATAAPVPKSAQANMVGSPVPALTLVAVETEPPGAMFGTGPSLSDGMACPYLPAVDREAEADFPLIGDGRPFQDVARARWSPVFCARIGRNGRILELRPTAIRSGNAVADRATGRELLRLRFRPALRGDRPAEAWHRILVNLPGTTLPRITDKPTPLDPPVFDEPFIRTD